MRAPHLFRLLWLLAGLALALAWLRAPALNFLLRGKPLGPLEPAASTAWFHGGFRADGAYATTQLATLPANIPRAGSWVDSDDWQGRTETIWFAAPRTVRVGVAGYPQKPGCSLYAEFRSPDGTLTRVACPLADPREQWVVWDLARPAGANAVRLVAEDHATGPGGWLAFSQPFSAWPSSLAVAYLHAQLYATLALALTLLWGPGLLWCPQHLAPELRAAIRLGAGPLILVVLALGLWLLAGLVRPQLPALLAVAALWLALGFSAHRRRFELLPEPAHRRLFALIALIALAAVARSAHSLGPPGELFRGSISRNFSIGDRIDSRYPFYVVQAAANHINPAAPDAEKLFFPWTFFSRGPLAGLVTLPVVLATHGQPPVPPNFPDGPWSPFDHEGFAAFRVTMLVLASGIVFATFTLLVPFVGDRWALLGAGLLALSPFGVHEVLFTWPKWPATAWATLAFALAHARRPTAAGLALGLGYLFHPLVLLWAPWLGLWTLARAERRPLPILAAGARIVLGTAAIVLPWMITGALMPHLPDTPAAGQGGFIRYWVLADWHTATWETWLRTRWMNFANTFIPLHVFFHSASYAHPKFTSAYEQSAPLVKFAQVWWVSLPFALGLGLWTLSFAALARTARALRAATWLFAFVPALFIVAYWGMDPLGLMRECGHPFFVALIALCTIAAATYPSTRYSRLLAHPAAPWLQLPETLLMLWLTTLLNPQPWRVAFANLDAFSLALNLLALAGAAALLARARSATCEAPQAASTSSAIASGSPA